MGVGVGRSRKKGMTIVIKLGEWPKIWRGKWASTCSLIRYSKKSGLIKNGRDHWRTLSRVATLAVIGHGLEGVESGEIT